MSPLILDYQSKRRTGTGKARPFITTPAKPKDVRRLVDIEFLAFEYEQVNQVLSFRDYKKPSHFERSVRMYEDVLNSAADFSVKNASAAHGTADVSFTKVVDTDTGDIVSFAKVERKQYELEELHSPLDTGHEAEPGMNRDWFALNERLRRQYVGLNKHFYIGMLATEPKHQHNGAGTMLLEEILAEADDAGVEVYLEATDTAKPLYERHGFVALTELRFDPAEYGIKGLGVERQTVMVRGALQSSAERKAVSAWEDAVARAQMQVREAEAAAAAAPTRCGDGVPTRGDTWVRDAWSACR